jgi:APA family basic amino acid/polyamine antiporter
VVSVDFIWFGLTAATVFVFRRRATTRGEATETSSAATEASSTSNARVEGEGDEPAGASVANESGGFRVPGHPWTTAFFVAACALIVISTVYEHLADSGVGLLIVAAGVPVYYYWSTRRGR